MSARLLADANGAAVYLSRWQDLVPVVAAAGGCDAMFADTPYSAKTQSGHDDGAESSNKVVDRPDVRGNKRRLDMGLRAIRREISYPCWTPDDVSAFVTAWSPLCRGWFVSITDEHLAPAWREAFEASGRYVFGTVPYLAPGSRVRLTGDGPSSWACWIVVARPKSRAFSKWGTLPGGYNDPESLTDDGHYPGSYLLPPGEGGAMPVVGGKTLWIMERLVEDYSRRGDLCVDATCGAGTSAAAAIRTGRRAIVGDMNREHAEMAARWVLDPGPKCPTESEARQQVLFGGAP